MTQKTPGVIGVWEVIAETEGATLYYPHTSDTTCFEAYDAANDWVNANKKSYDSVTELLKDLESRNLTNTEFVVKMFAEEYQFFAKEEGYNDDMIAFSEWVTLRTVEKEEFPESLGMAHTESDGWFYQSAIVFDSIDKSPFEGRRFIPVREAKPAGILFGVWSALVDAAGESASRMEQFRKEFAPTYESPVKVPVSVLSLGEKYVVAYLMVFMVAPSRGRGGKSARWWTHSSELKRCIGHRLDIAESDVMNYLYEVNVNN